MIVGTILVTILIILIIFVFLREYRKERTFQEPEEKWRNDRRIREKVKEYEAKSKQENSEFKI